MYKLLTLFLGKAAGQCCGRCAAEYCHCDHIFVCSTTVFSVCIYPHTNAVHEMICEDKSTEIVTLSRLCGLLQKCNDALAKVLRMRFVECKH